jgi:hypothetical protein
VSAVGRMLEGRSDAYIPVLAGDTEHPSLDLPAVSMPLRRLSPFLSLRRSVFAAWLLLFDAVWSSCG